MNNIALTLICIVVAFILGWIVATIFIDKERCSGEIVVTKDGGEEYIFLRFDNIEDIDSLGNKHRIQLRVTHK